MLTFPVCSPPFSSLPFQLGLFFFFFISGVFPFFFCFWIKRETGSDTAPIEGKTNVWKAYSELITADMVALALY